MASVWILLGVLVAFLAAEGGAVSTEILEPVRSTGVEVALIFIPEMGFSAGHYKKTAQAIQAASNLRVWAVLTGHYFASVPGVYQIPAAIENAIQHLKKAGMTSEKYIGVGHGLGGFYLQIDGKKSELKAIVLMGTFLPREDKLHDYPLPILTLAADLDGETLLTRIAVEYEKLKEDLLSSPSSLYRTPVIVIEGANHAQFASEPLPHRPSSRHGDLTPDITEEDAHRMIGKHVDSFLTATFSNSSFEKGNASRELEQAYYNSTEKLQPFLDINTFSSNDNYSQWTITAQKHFAGKYADQVEVSNEVTDSVFFMFSEPSISKVGNISTINTITFVDFEDHARDMDSEGESAVEISMKLKSQDAISQAVDAGKQPVGPSTSLISEPRSCKSLNELALKIALDSSSPIARDRYNVRGRPMIFEEDSEHRFEILWVLSALSTWQDSVGLHVRSVSMRTSIDNLFGAKGVHYCKVISPYQAMEWVNIDSLRELDEDWL